MSMGPLGGVAGSAAGSPLAQTQGPETERAHQDAVGQTRRAQSEQKAEAAAGIGQTDGEDHQTADRDADGRRPWEPPPESKEAEATGREAGGPANRQGKDPSGQAGNLLDLSG